MSNGPGAPSVAVLLAVHNGAGWLTPLLASLARNRTSFTLHWIDDASTDESVAVLHRECSEQGITQHEWRAGARQGVPNAFFFLLERVTADFYLFCDQDDIWEPGKIDATVSRLAGESRPFLCFSDPKLFSGQDTSKYKYYFQTLGLSVEVATARGRALVFNPCVGNTVGFNRALRDLWLRHAEIARAHAAMHDWWLYLLALTYGGVALLTGVPTTLYRQHGGNTLGVTSLRRQANLPRMWRKQKHFRRLVARQARGYLEVLERQVPAQGVLAQTAAMLAHVDQQLTLADVLRLRKVDAVPVSTLRAMLFMIGCLVSDAS